MTKAEVRRLFPALFAEWRAIPEVSRIDEQQLRFGDFHSWLRAMHPGATEFRSRMGALANIEQWFDIATHQSGRS